MAAKNEQTTDDSVMDALGKASPEQLRAIMAKAGIAPTTIGMTTETMQMLIGSLSATNADAVKLALKSQQKENPAYPERSVFFPEGKFDDEGNALRPKVVFRRPTFMNNVHLHGELETEEEINLFNAISEDKRARDGRWTADILDRGTARERIMVIIPSFTPDERNESNLPLPLILRELIGGPDAVTELTMSKRIAELEAKMQQMATV